jgi:hypothetical protein
MPQAPARRATGEPSDVPTLVRLHHRRRGWALVATGSVLGLAVYAGIDVNLVEKLTGTAEALSAISILMLLALALAGLVVVIVDTARIHRSDAGARESAKASVSHYPVYAHAHRWPPRHFGSWVAAVFMLIVMTSIAAYILPTQVNSWAYVVGAENQDTFNPVSYSHCPVMHGRGCRIVTEGYLSRSGAHVNWGTQVPLGQPFSVRDPLWPWGTGRSLIDGDGSAIPDIVAGLFFDAVAILLLSIVVVLMRETSPTPGRRSSVPAGAAPGGVRQTHQPDPGHHPNGGRRYARRRRRAR